MKFIVYYTDNVNYEETIHAKNGRDAAIKFLKNIPRDDDCQICVEAKEFGSRNEDGIFNTLDLLPEVAVSNRRPIQTILDKNILHGFDVLLFEEIIQRHPYWLEYANPNKEEDYIVEIHIPCPIKGNPPMHISFGEGELSPIVGFGFAWYDWYNLRKFFGVSWEEWTSDDSILVADAVDEFVENITSEKLFIAEWKTMFGLSRKYNLIDSNTYEKLKEEDKIIRSISWLGSYNFNYNGEWAIPHSNQA